MRYLRFPFVKAALLLWAAMLPIAWLADWTAFEGTRPPLGPWTLLVLMVGPLLFSAAFSFAVLKLPAVSPAWDRSRRR